MPCTDLLHLLGYDDHTPEDARAMHSREDELLTAIGYGPVYSGGPHQRDHGDGKSDSS